MGVRRLWNEYECGYYTWAQLIWEARVVSRDEVIENKKTCFYALGLFHVKSDSFLHRKKKYKC